MHNAAFASQGLGWVYVPFRVAPEHLGEAVRAVRALNLAGLNVTIPHKVAVLEYLDELDESARLIGAVNTIVNKGGRLIGYNTDGAGFLRSLRSDAGTEPRGRSLLLVAREEPHGPSASSWCSRVRPGSTSQTVRTRRRRTWRNT